MHERGGERALRNPHLGAQPVAPIQQQRVEHLALELRKAAEEVGLQPESVDVVATLPGVYLTPQRTEFVPVIGW